MYRKILQEPLTFPSSDIVPPAARDLLTRLLDRDPVRRLGANGAAEIKSHHFFANIDWRKLLQRKYEPSFRPNVVCNCLPPDVLYNPYLTSSRSMPVIQKTLIANLPPRHPRTHTLMALSCRRQCSNNSPGGRTTDQWLASVTPVAVSKTPRLEASRSRNFCSFKLNRTLICVPEREIHGLIETISLFTACMSFIHISILICFFTFFFGCSSSHCLIFPIPKESCGILISELLPLPDLRDDVCSSRFICPLSALI